MNEIFPPVCYLIVDELSKVKNDLEAALKDVLRAMRINQETILSDAALNIPNLERLANVSVSHVQTMMLNSYYYSYILLFLKIG